MNPDPIADNAVSLWCAHAWVEGAVRPAVSVEIADGRFTSVRPNTRPAANAEQLDGLVLPGMANVHSHAFHRALRGRTHDDSGSFWTWRDLMYQVANRLDPDRYYALARGVFAEMVLAGITAVGEFHYVHHQPDGSHYDEPNAMGHALRAAADDAGLRLSMLDAIYLYGGLGPQGYEPVRAEQRRFSDGNIDVWQQRVAALVGEWGGDDRVRVGAAIHSIRAVNPPTIRQVARFASEHDMVLHAHVAEQTAEVDATVRVHGASPAAVFAAAGATSARFTAVHATHLEPSDRSRFVDDDSSVCFCPTTERDLGDGIGPAHELIERGVYLCLGTDSHCEIDLLGEARALEHNDRLRLRRRAITAPSQLLELATINGHRALGFTDAGRIGAGQRADLVVLDDNSVGAAGSGQTVASAIFARDVHDVQAVMIDGEWKVRDRQHQHVDAEVELESAIAALLGPGAVP